MAWEIYIQDLPDVPQMADVPPTHVPSPIGTRADLMARLLAAVPMAEQQDEDWLFVRADGIDLSAQLYLEDGDHVRCIVVHVHSGGRSATCVSELIKASGCRALDTATGEFFDPKVSAV